MTARGHKLDFPGGLLKTCHYNPSMPGKTVGRIFEIILFTYQQEEIRNKAILEEGDRSNPILLVGVENAGEQ